MKTNFTKASYFNSAEAHFQSISLKLKIVRVYLLNIMPGFEVHRTNVQNGKDPFTRIV